MDWQHIDINDTTQLVLQEGNHAKVWSNAHFLLHIYIVLELHYVFLTSGDTLELIIDITY